MKKVREESYLGTQENLPATTRGKFSGPAQASGGTQKLTTDEALAYVKAVNEMFKDRKEKYDEFLEVMKEFKAQRIDTAGVIARVKDLFKGHRNLILGFNTFLPKGHEIYLPPEDEHPPKKQRVEFDRAINYVNKIKTRFQYDEQIYKAFLEILNMYRKGNKSKNEVYEEIAELFKDHQDLLEECTYFLGDSCDTAHVPHAPSSARVVPFPASRRDERNPSLALPKHPHGEKMITSIDRDRSVERPDHDGEKPSSKIKKGHWKRVEKEKERKDDRERIDRDRDEDLDPMQRLPQERKSARRADELICKQTQGGEACGDKDDQLHKNYNDLSFLCDWLAAMSLKCSTVKERAEKNYIDYG